LRRPTSLPQGSGELLAIPSYRRYVASSTLGAFASTVQFLAQGWLLLTIAPGGWALVAFLAVRLGVKSVFALPAGVLADRLPRARLYAWMRVASAAGSAISACALLTPEPLLVALAGAAVAAASHALDLPAHRALQGEVQPEPLLERGLALGTSGHHAASLAAPVVAFPLAASLGAGAPLALSGVVFAIAAVPAFRIVPAATRVARTRAHHDIAAALRFVAGAPIVIALLLAMTLPSVVDKAVAVALPSQAGAEGEGSFGLVLAAPELGGIAVGFVLAALRWQFTPWIPLFSAGAYALTITAASIAAVVIGFELIALALFIGGCAKTTLITSALAGIQRHVPAEMRGRIMTI